MTLQPSTAQPTTASHPIAKIAIVIATVLVVMAALTAIFGVDASGPGYEIVPDPAGFALPF